MIEPLDCGDNSCLFAERKGGMRTNGGCRCLDGIEDRELIRRIKLTFANTRQREYEISKRVKNHNCESALLEHTPKGTRIAYLTETGEVLVLGRPPQDENEETGHNCDAMGCGCNHVIERYHVRAGTPEGK